MWFFSQSLIGKPALPIEGEAWFNAQALPPAGASDVADGKILNVVPNLRGFVTLIHFWDYNCIHCLNELPFIKNWWQRYRDHRFLIIGVHTPEFAFAKDSDKVQSAVMRFGLTYPVVSDPNYITWSRYKNTAWPRQVLCDAGGIIRFDNIGEGEHETKEVHIQELIRVAQGQLV